MPLTDDDRRRIEEEEYRKMARERLERTVRVEADIRTQGDQRLEVRGVGTEIYRDTKRAGTAVIRWVLVVLFALVGLMVADLVWIAVCATIVRSEGPIGWVFAGCVALVCLIAWIKFVRMLLARVRRPSDA